jgi:hypothetical protein
MGNGGIRSRTDGNRYVVLLKHADSQRAADILGELNLFAISIIDRLCDVYLRRSPNNSKDMRGYIAALILYERYKSKNLEENEPENITTTSFTQNKGEKIAICLREKKTGTNQLHNVHVLKFVMLHELAHIFTSDAEHVIDFWVNFKFLLEFARDQNIYVSTNYNIAPSDCCGIEIVYNPMFSRIDNLK